MLELLVTLPVQRRSSELQAVVMSAAHFFLRLAKYRVDVSKGQEVGPNWPRAATDHEVGTGQILRAAKQTEPQSELCSDFYRGPFAVGWTRICQLTLVLDPSTTCVNAAEPGDVPEGQSSQKSCLAAPQTVRNWKSRQKGQPHEFSACLFAVHA